MSIHAPPPSATTLSTSSKYHGPFVEKSLCKGSGVYSLNGFGGIELSSHLLAFLWMYGPSSGLVVDAEVVTTHRHSVLDGDNTYHRYTVITVRPRHANRYQALVLNPLYYTRP